jgi:hypothetical protein
VWVRAKRVLVCAISNDVWIGLGQGQEGRSVEDQKLGVQRFV